MHHWVYCRAIFQNVAKKLGSSREENNILCFWLSWCNELLYVHCGKVFHFSLFTTIYVNTYTYPSLNIPPYIYILIVSTHFVWISTRQNSYIAFKYPSYPLHFRVSLGSFQTANVICQSTFSLSIFYVYIHSKCDH